MANKLKKMQLSSVDLVHAGANQEANISFFKSRPKEANTATAEFNSCMESFTQGVESVLKSNQTPEEKAEEMQKGFEEFRGYITKAFKPWSRSESATQPQEVTSVVKNEKEGAEMTDVSKMSKEELEALQKSITEELQKNHQPAGSEAAGTPSAAQENVVKSEGTPPVPAKTEYIIPESVQKTLDDLKARVEKSERAEMAGVVKKYEILGVDAEKLAGELYNMKKSAPAMYDTTIGILDQQLEITENSGMFAEIGKSGAGMETGEGKAEAIAKSYMEKDPALSYHDAFIKAIEMNPELLPIYDK